MPSKISKEERALIDAAIAAGKVTICPPCTFSGAEDWTWRERQRAQRAAMERAQRVKKATAGVVEPEPRPARVEPAPRPRRQPDERALRLREQRRAERWQRDAERVAALKKLMQTDMTQMEIALELKISPMTVSRWIRRIKNGDEPKK